MKRPFRLRLILLCLGIAVVIPLAAVDTTFWQVGTFDEILEGRLTGVSLDKDGVLRLAKDTEPLFSPDVSVALSMAADPSAGGRLYIGTGHQGKVFRTDSTKKGTLFFTASEPDIFAMAVGPDGALYVGTSPEGKIYRVTPDGKSSVFFDPKAKYIWAMAFDSKGSLFAGTGDRGLIYRIDASGKGAVFFDSHQTHIMCLKFDAQGNLLAGSDPDGLVYRVTPAGKPYVLYQSNLPEIHDLAVDSRGHIYAAALGGPGGKGGAPFLGPNIQPGPAVSNTTVTVVAGTEEGASTAQTRPAEPGGNAFSRNAPMAMGFMPPAANLGKGSLVEISPDYSAETVWTSNNEAVFGLAVKGDEVYFSTDTDGRVFDLNSRRDSRELTLLSETGETMATRLLFNGPDLFIATSNVARLIRLGSSTVKEGTYESTVKDTKTISRWGTLSWRGEAPEGTSVEFFTRSGNSDRPDLTWSDWKGPYLSANGSPIENDPARYIQWKAILKTTNGSTPALDEVTVSYLNQNLPPEIRSFTVSSPGESGNPAGPAPSSFGGERVQSPMTQGTISFGPPARSKAPSNGTATMFSWQAEDPNGDQLVYSLYVRSSDETEWHLLKDQIRQPNYMLEPHQLPDGKYVAKLVASDEDSNSPETTRKSEAMSSAFWVDSTPPVITVTRQTANAEGAEVQFQAEDAISPLQSAESSTDGKDWRDIVSDDGVVDSRQERFTVRVRGLAPGEHIIMLRAYDAVGNVGLGKAVIHVAAGGSR